MTSWLQNSIYKGLGRWGSLGKVSATLRRSDFTPTGFVLSYGGVISIVTFLVSEKSVAAGVPWDFWKAGTSSQNLLYVKSSFSAAPMSRAHNATCWEG